MGDRGGTLALPHLGADVLARRWGAGHLAVAAERREIAGELHDGFSREPLDERYEVLAALGDPDGVALLFQLLDDSDASVREAAVQALERMGGPTRSAPSSKKQGDE